MLFSNGAIELNRASFSSSAIELNRASLSNGAIELAFLVVQ